MRKALLFLLAIPLIMGFEVGEKLYVISGPKIVRNYSTKNDALQITASGWYSWASYADSQTDIKYQWALYAKLKIKNLGKEPIHFLTDKISIQSKKTPFKISNIHLGLGNGSASNPTLDIAPGKTLEVFINIRMLEGQSVAHGTKLGVGEIITLNLDDAIVNGQPIIVSPIQFVGEDLL